MICVYYLASPLLVRADRWGWTYCLLPVLVGVSLLVPRGSVWMNAVHFLAAYMLGMLCSRYRGQVLAVVARLWPLLVLVAALCVWLDFHFPIGSEAWNDLQKLAMCPVFLYWLKRTDRAVGPFLAPLATASFGIYFLHPYVMEMLRRLSSLVGLDAALRGANLPLCIAMYAATVGLSLAAVIAARRLLGPYSRMIVGS